MFWLVSDFDASCTCVVVVAFKTEVTSCYELLCVCVCVCVCVSQPVVDSPDRVSISSARVSLRPG